MSFVRRSCACTTPRSGRQTPSRAILRFTTRRCDTCRAGCQGRPLRAADRADAAARAAQGCATPARRRPCPEDSARTVEDVCAEERPRLLALPADRFDRHERIEVRIGKTPYARFDLNDYSVPHDRISRTLSVLATTERVRIFERHTLVADHPRSYDRAAQIEDPEHIAALIRRKRAARKHATSQSLIAAVPAIADLLKAAADRNHNIGSIVLALKPMLQHYSAADLTEAIQQSIARGAPHPNSARLLFEQIRQQRQRGPVNPVSLPGHLSQRDVIIAPHNLQPYDRLQDLHHDDS